MFYRILNRIANKDIEDQDIEAYRQYVLVTLFFIVGMIFLFVMGIIAVVQENLALAMADFLTVLILAVFVYMMRKNRNHVVYCRILITITGVFYLYLFMMGGVDQSAHVWCYTFPVIASFIVGHKQGMIYSAIMTIILLLSQIAAHSGMAFITAYNVNFLIRFFAAYAIIAFVSCIAEWARANTYARMIMFHKNMKNTINELEKARAELRTLTNIDPLTGIYNKRYLNVSMQMFSGCADKKYIVSMFFDIDHFKKYNDYYGHINGDRVLVEVVKTIKDRVQSSDGILVRFGGEEIVCLVKTDDIKSVENMAKYIIKDFARKHIENNQVKIGYITVSIGIAYCLVAQWDGWQSIVKRSDEAMYKAKGNGKNRYCIE